MSSAETLVVIITIIGLGIVAQVLSDRLRMPSVLFLIIAGILAGPDVLGVIHRDAFGDALPTIVGLSVAIIVFEGAFHLSIDKLQNSPREVIKLVTIGAFIAFLGTAGVVYYVIGASSEISLLIGALLIATGPTVITPILDVVDVRERVAGTLETEGIVNDVTAAVLGIVMFEFVVMETEPVEEVLRQFVSKLGTGVLIGMFIAAVTWYVLREIDLTENAPQNSRLIVLAGALITYGLAEGAEPESGIAAVATAGVLLGNSTIPHKDEIEKFKGDLTVFVLSFVFITLASLISLENLFGVGIAGFVVVLAVMFVIRPVLVFLSTMGDRFTFREKIFISLAGPRGIIPASVATLFAIELQNRGLSDEAGVLAGTVFLVILATVVIEGGFARHIAELLDVIPMKIVIVGAGKVGTELAQRLEQRGESVVLIDKDEEAVEEARKKGYTVQKGDGRDIETLQRAGVNKAKTVAAATADDSVNLVVSQLSKSKFDIDKVVARINDPENRGAFEELGVRTIEFPMAVAWAMDNTIERPALWKWMTEIGKEGDIQEIEVTSEEVVGKTIDEIDPEIPDGCIIALVSRNGKNQIPSKDLELKFGDHITFVGRKKAVDKAVRRYHPHD